MDETKKTVLEILEEIKPGTDFENDTDLTGHGILDSLSIITLTMELNERFGIEITPLDIVPDNFRTVDAITEMTNRLENE
jgi:acyl carrier protein